MKKLILPFVALMTTLLASAALADQPHDWGYRFQEAATGIMEEIHWFERYTLWFVIPITLFVLGLLIYVSVRFSAKNNPTPSRTSHNSLIEVIWTIGPVIILLFIAVPSFKLLASEFSPPSPPTLTVKATGYQWYWGYEYQTEDAVTFESRLVPDADRPGLGKDDRKVYPTLLTVDNELVVPVGETVRLIVTASDVLHAFAMPAFGIKIDAVPGRLNETWFKAEKEGLYYGQCSEICGKDHAYMPIAIRVVDKGKYDAWFAAAKTDLPAANKALMAAAQQAVSVDVAGN